MATSNPQTRSKTPWLAAAFAISVLAAATPGRGQVAPTVEPPLVAGFERFHRTDKTKDVAAGLLLLGELGCARCHVPERRATAIQTKQAPRLNVLRERFDAAWLRRYLDDPAATDPGTTMPNVLAATGPDRAAAVEELVHYVASRGKPRRRTVPDRAAIRRGGELYHRIGCVACHRPHRGESKDTRALLPLEKLERKWSHASLQQFLQRPLAVRPSGRMPELSLRGREAHDLAHYLLRDREAAGPLGYAAYLGRFPHVDDIAKSLPDRTGIATSIGLDVKPRRNSYALVFDGWLDVRETGEYTFHLRADDRARLVIDGESVLDIPRARKRVFSRRVRLEAGKRPLRVLYVQHGATAYLDLEWEGPGVPRGKIPSERLSSTLSPVAEQPVFEVDASMAARGRERFVKSGCASCHEAKAPPAGARALESLSRAECTAASYALDDRQREAIAAALAATREGLAAANAAERLEQSLVRQNCYACHERGGRGGILDACSEHFLGENDEEAAEACFPPPLTGVGDKLRRPWLVRVLEEGTSVRPALPVRMPRYGRENVSGMADAFIALDRSPAKLPAVRDDAATLRAAGRELVGTSGLGCIKCHVFHEHDAPQMQSPDLVLSTERVHRDWFARFVRNPEKLKPGTRMPALWSSSGSGVTDVLGGDIDRQIAAMWTYLADGRKAIHPVGLTRKKLELVVGGRAVLYRGKIRDVGFRGICVGFPDQLNIAFDAEQLRLALLWKGRFLNVAAHWRVQGMGRIRPLGHSVVKLPQGPSFAFLASPENPWPETPWPETPWPETKTRARGFRFIGYDLDERREPTLRYGLNRIVFEDEPRVVESGTGHALRRTIRITCEDPVEGLLFRAARGREIVAVPPAYAVDRKLTLRIDVAGTRVRKVSGWSEVLVPIRFSEGESRLVIDYTWRSER